MKNKVLLAGVMAMVWMAAMIVRGADMPAVEIPVCREAPVMDGNLADASWHASLTVTNFVIIDKEGFPPATNVTAKLMRDAEWLYVGFEIRHPKPDSIAPKAKAKHRDERVQGENCVKVAFDPGTGGKQWYHIRLSAGNVIFDQRNSARGVNWGWNIPLRSATRITPTGWQAEMALPFTLLMDVGEPEKAKINLVAHTFTPILDQQFVEVREECAVASWAPTTRAWWNAPGLFVPIKGLDKAVFKTPFLPMLESARVGRYILADGAYTYAVSGHMQNVSSCDGRVKVRVTDIPVTGRQTAIVETVTIPAGAGADWSVTTRVEAVVRRNLRVTMESESGEVLGSMWIENPAGLNMFSAYLDRNYYTTETEAGVVCRIGLPDEGLKDTRLAVRTEAGKLLGETREVRPETRWAFPLKPVAEGSHPVRIEFRRKDGALIADQAVPLVKRPPKPGCEWKVDREHRVFLNNGMPFFPFGVVASRPVGAFHFKTIADIGFNSVLQWARSQFTVDEYMRMAQTNNLYVILTDDVYVHHDEQTKLRDPGGLLSPEDLKLLNQGLKSSVGSLLSMKGWMLTAPFANLPMPAKKTLYMEYYRNNIPYITGYVKGGKDYPNLLGYFILDEPCLETGVVPVGRAFYALLKELDGYHPVFVNYSSSIPNTPDAVNWSDALGTDPYWIPGFGADSVGRNSVRFVPGVVAMTRKRADEVHSVTWTIPMAEIWSATHKRALTGAEQKCQTYLALIHGTKGLFYFIYPFQSLAMIETFRELSAQMKLLGPVCVQPDMEQTITYTPGKLDPLNNLFTDVQAVLKTNPAGGYVLLAANSANYPVDTRITIQGLSDGAKQVSRLFSSETYDVRKGEFSDRIEGMGVRAYLIGCQTADDRDQQSAISNQKSAINIQVAMTPLTNQAVQEFSYPSEGRMDKRNRIPNPSYEEASLKGWPDYHKKTWGWRESLESLIGGKEQNWGLSTEQPFHGKQCLMLLTTNNVDHVIDYMVLTVRNDKSRDYVFSAYMRANRDDVKVTLKTGHSVKKENVCTLNREWKRYHVSVTMPVGDHYAVNMVILRENAGETIVWVDALQFEEGTEPTAFEP